MRIANRAGAALLGVSLLALVYVAIQFREDASRYESLNTATDNVHLIVDMAQTALSALKDAETGQRGFLITRDPAYLGPYNSGVMEFDAAMDKLRFLTHSDTSVTKMAEFGEMKKREMAVTIALARAGRDDNAIERLRAGIGKKYMDSVRAMTAQTIHAAEVVHKHNTEELTRQENATSMKVQSAVLVLFLLTFTGATLLHVEIRRERRTAARLEASEKKYRDLAQDLERKVESRTETLKQLNTELMAFSYSVSHDLRAPLRSIDGFSQIVLEDYSERLDDTGRDMLRRIRLAAKRMGELIESLLGLSRVTRVEPERQRVSISAIAESVLSGVVAAGDRRVEMRVQPGLTAEADPQLIRIVFENLLSNAYKFTAGAAAPRIEVGRVSSSGKPAFFVRDNGAGFDSAKADRLFTPFQRFHTEAEFEGTGIGLATVQRIVHRHGGTIWAESSRGAGATFYFTVPPRGDVKSDVKLEFPA